MLAIAPSTSEVTRGGLAFAVLALLFAVQSWLQLNAPINHDVSWYIYIARGLLSGKQLYVDFIEVNPPLGMWMMMPIVWLADSFQMRADHVYKALMIVITAASLAGVYRYIKFLPQWSKSNRHIFIVGLAIAFLFLPGAEFGQREHLLILLFAPWLFLRLARCEQAQIGVIEAVAVGVLAAVAISLKPQSAIAPLFVEFLILWKYRKLKNLFAPENLAAAATVFTYLVVIFTVTPEYVWDMIPLARAAYYPFYGFSLDVQLLKARWCLMAVFLVLIALKFVPLERKFQVCALFAASCGFVISYAVQNKGYGYQILPASAFAWGALAFIFAEICNDWRKQKVLMCLIAALGAIHILSEDRFYSPGDAPFIAGIERYAPDARTVAFASTSVGHGFPFVEMKNLKLASRYPTQWLIPYVASKWNGGPLPEDELVKSTLLNVVDDLITGQPDIIFIDQSNKQNYMPKGRFDYIAFWSNDERFLPFWQNYERRGEVLTFAVFTKRTTDVSVVLKGTFAF